MRIHSILFLLAVGCSTSPSGPGQGQLESALETWSVHGPSSYSFTWRQSCECTLATTGPIRITVENDAITSAVYVETEQPVSADIRSHLRTIDGVFDMIQDAIDDSAFAITVQYSTESGHPTSVAIDYDEQLADEELSLEISDFHSNVQHHSGDDGVRCGGL